MFEEDKNQEKPEEKEESRLCILEIFNNFPVYSSEEESTPFTSNIISSPSSGVFSNNSNQGFTFGTFSNNSETDKQGGLVQQESIKKNRTGTGTGKGPLFTIQETLNESNY